MRERTLSLTKSNLITGKWAIGIATKTVYDVVTVVDGVTGHVPRPTDRLDRLATRSPVCRDGACFIAIETTDTSGAGHS